MKNKYTDYMKTYGSYIDINDYKSSSYGEYFSSEYSNIYKQIFESEEDRLKRESKEKAEKRNNKIDQILGE